MPDLTAHVTAYQAQWGRRYLDPSRKPWKTVLDHYIADKHQEGRGILLSSANTAAIINKLPKGANFMKHALKQFVKLGLKPDDLSDDTGPSAAGEPLWVNPRFHVKGVHPHAIHHH